MKKNDYLKILGLSKKKIEKYVCTKCKSTECLTWERQLRGADEMTSVFTQCQVCYYTEISN